MPVKHPSTTVGVRFSPYALDFSGRLIQFKTAGGGSLERGKTATGHAGVTILPREANDAYRLTLIRCRKRSW
jgi:hypothetical protein